MACRVFPNLLHRPARGFLRPSRLVLTPACIGARYLSSQPANERIPNFAFAFDIDGVLLRSSTAIPGASESLQYLKSARVPFILLTNGGGKPESKRTNDINDKLLLPPDAQVAVSQLIQSHTPLSELATTHGSPSYKKKTVLILGGDGEKCRHVAEAYGFENVVLPGDIYAAHPELWPFSSNFGDYYSTFARPLPKPINPEAGEADTLKIDAVMVFNDPRDWGLECQLLVDVLLSYKGILGTYSNKNGKRDLENHGYQSDGQPPVYFTNPDLLWASAYPLSRLGQGGFREAMVGVWNAVTKTASGESVPLKYTIMGKPHGLTYEYAEKVLLRQREQAFGKDGTQEVPLKKVYMIGDNPESDIMGANNYQSLVDAQWMSVLTRTGVYKDREGEQPTVKPKVIVDNVREGVRWALRDSGWDGKI